MDVGRNDITGDAAQELASVVLSKPTLEIFCNIPIKKLRADSLSELDLSGKGVGVPGALVLANLLPVTGALTKLSLAQNKLEVEGTKAICEALEQNKTLKELDISGDKWNSNIGGSAGVKHVAKMLGVSGGLTALNFSHNYLKDEGVSAICKAIQSNKETKLASLNFKNNLIGPGGANAVAAMVAVTGGLTKLSLAHNMLREEGTKAICEALEQNTSLKELDICGSSYDSNIGGSAGARHVAKMVGVNGGLTKISLAENGLGEEGTKAICEALEQNKTLKELDIRGSIYGENGNIGGTAGVKHVAKMLAVNGVLTSLNLSSNQIGGYWDDDQKTCVFTPVGPKAIADALLVNGGLTKISLAQNKLEEDGTKAICEALEQNKTLKELDISGDKRNSNIGGTAGVKHVAKMLGVSGALTVTNLLGNQLDAASAKMLAEVAKQKGISLCGIRRDQTTANFRNKDLKPPDAVLLASDLSQAVVTGALTKIE